MRLDEFSASTDFADDFSVTQMIRFLMVGFDISLVSAVISYTTNIISFDAVSTKTATFDALSTKTLGFDAESTKTLTIDAVR